MMPSIALFVLSINFRKGNVPRNKIVFGNYTIFEKECDIRTN